MAVDVHLLGALVRALVEFRWDCLECVAVLEVGIWAAGECDVFRVGLLVGAGASSLEIRGDGIR